MGIQKTARLPDKTGKLPSAVFDLLCGLTGEISLSCCRNWHFRITPDKSGEHLFSFLPRMFIHESFQITSSFF